jgi:hypothetical protein
MVVALLCSACASQPTPNPDIEGTNFRDRIQTQSGNGVTVRAGVPSARETEEIFDMDLYKRGVQPVWLEVVNETDLDLGFLPVGLDPSYFTPIETATIDLKPKELRARDRLRDVAMFKAGMGVHLDAGATRSGYVFSVLDEGTKTFNVDVIEEGFLQSFTFFIPVPGLRVDHYDVDWANLYPEDSVRDLDRDQLIAWLEEQVCCTTDKDAEGSGDPVNLVVIGEPLDVYVAFIRAGWDETETITSSSSWKTVKSFVSGGEYRYSPVSGLYVFGRPQDVAFQKARDNIHERNHLRLWLAPVRFDGQPVWLGQISRDIGVRFTRKTITTHKIDPDVDETREYLLEDLAYAQALQKMAYVGGVGEVDISQPAGNLTGDPWFSDGMRLVLWVTSEPVAIHDIVYESWRARPK